MIETTSIQLCREGASDDRPGPAQIVRRATGEKAEALRREGQRLAAAAHPGVVELIRSVATEDGWELRTAHGGRPLSTVERLAPGRVAALIAAVAETVADLHDMGIVHGRITAEHVVLGPSGRPRLCGFDPSISHPAGCALDVAAMGSLITSLLEGAGDMDPIPQARLSRAARASSALRRALLTVADQACADEPSRRPTARRLASTLADLVPPAPPAHGRSTTRRGGLFVRSVVPGALVGSLLVAGLLALTGARGPDRGRAPETGGSAEVALEPVHSEAAQPPPSTVTTVPLSSTTTAALGPPCVPPQLVRSASEGPCAPGVVVSGNTITVDGRHFEAGEPGDLATLGDWDCDGTATPALLRPSTGEVFVFDAWPTDATTTVSPLEAVPGAVALTPTTDTTRPGCAALVATLADGSEKRVRLGGGS